MTISDKREAIAIGGVAVALFAVLRHEAPLSMASGYGDCLPLGLPLEDAVTSTATTEFSLHGE